MSVLELVYMRDSRKDKDSNYMRMRKEIQGYISLPSNKSDRLMRRRSRFEISKVGR